MMGERNKQDGLTNFSVGEADPTWEPRLLIDNHAASARRLQLRVALIEEWRELLRWQRDELKRSFRSVTS